MDERHLTPAQLLAWIDGGLHDSSASRHASRCPICKMRREDVERGSRLEEQSRDPGRHVDPQCLTRYAEGVLTKEESVAAEAHMLACDECLEDLRILELSLAREEFSAGTPPRVVTRALEAFRRSSVFDAAPRIGTLRIWPNEPSSGGYAVRFERQWHAGPVMFGMPTSPSASRLLDASARNPRARHHLDADSGPEVFERLSESVPSSQGVPGTFSLALGGHDISIRVDGASNGQIRIELRLPFALIRASVVAVDDAGRELVAQQGLEGKELRWAVLVGRGETRLLVTHGDVIWEIAVVV